MNTQDTKTPNPMTPVITREMENPPSEMLPVDYAEIVREAGKIRGGFTTLKRGHSILVTASKIWKARNGWDESERIEVEHQGQKVLVEKPIPSEHWQGLKAALNSVLEAKRLEFEDFASQVGVNLKQSDFRNGTISKDGSVKTQMGKRRIATKELPKNSILHLQTLRDMRQRYESTLKRLDKMSDTEATLKQRENAENNLKIVKAEIAKLESK